MHRWPDAPPGGTGAGGAVASMRLRALVAGPRPDEGRVFCHSIWFGGHNNTRAAALLARLPRLDPYLVTCSNRRIPRGLQYQALWYGRGVRNRVLMAAASRRYRFLLTFDPEQIPFFRGPVVVDLDDPRFSAKEIGLIACPNVAAYVVTDERAARRYQELGLDKPHHVIPQGIDLATLDPDRVAAVRTERRRPGDVVIGYVAAWLLTKDDPGGRSPLYNVDHLLELWTELQGRLPAARLWLVGEPSERVRQMCAGRHGIEVLGRLPLGEALAHVSNFDVALYPRRVDQGISASKVAEYMGLGVPTVSYDLEVTRMLADSGAGVMAATPRAFVAAVERLATDARERARVAACAAAVGRALDWDVLARRYALEVLDERLR